MAVTAAIDISNTALPGDSYGLVIGLTDRFQPVGYATGSATWSVAGSAAVAVIVNRPSVLRWRVMRSC